MSNFVSDKQVQDNLQKLEKILISEVPAYLKTTNATLIGTNNNEEIVSYKVLDCTVRSLDRFQLAFHAASVMYEADITLEKKTSDKTSSELHHVIVKTMPESPIVRLLQNSTDQFFNESKIFSNIFPTLLKVINNAENREHFNAAKELLPRCFYSSFDSKDGMLVLEDLRKQGYNIGGNKGMLMDYDHVELALKGLARFHALSYAMKKKDHKGYKEQVSSQIRDARHFVDKGNVTGFEREGYRMFLRHGGMLILKTFKEYELPGTVKDEEKINRVTLKYDNCAKLFRELLSPDEPLAVLCHGDFNMNNMLFRYDTNNKPCGVKFIDFQTMYYASPAIDLSFFLFLNTYPDVLIERWDELFSAYHNTLLQAISEFTDCPEEELLPDFNLELFKDQFSRYCLYGFAMATTFIMSLITFASKGDPFEKFKDGLPKDEEISEMLENEVKLEDKELLERIMPLTKHLLDQVRV